MNLRQSGILMPIFSLPSPCGIGSMGQEAREFADFLAVAGQRVWQLLPVGPTSYGDSPYQSFSAFAGNPYFIDLPTLETEGLLKAGEYRDIDWESTPESINYGALYQKRFPILRLAAARLLAAPPADYQDFCIQNAGWLPDYALFMALKNAHGGASWQTWPEPLRRREPAVLEAFRAAHSEELSFWQAVQYLFFRQWKELKRYANGLGISILGDLPIYVAEDSADVWAHPEQFQLDGDLRPAEVAGCPPDAFSADGQLWGNPLFDWDFMRRDGFSWWKARVHHQKQIYDLLRIDHFRGLAAYFSIPRGAPAQAGHWRSGPGMDLIRALEAGPGTAGIIAEDLGYLDDDVRALLRDSGIPGMKVLQFAFDSRESGDYFPHNYDHHCVVYSGTHDNDTAIGWFDTASADDVATAREYLHLTEEEGLNWGLMRGVWSSVGDLAIVQMQDILGLGSWARMNTPATQGQNWRWRMQPGANTAELAARLRRQAALYGRI